MPKRYALLIDLRKCVGCTSCQVSCKMENAVPMGKFRARVDFADTGTFPNAKRHFFPKLCNNCADPPCILPCPVKGATYKREDGVVMINRDLCIGCGRCLKACPYGARYIHPYLTVKNDPSPYGQEVPEVKGKTRKDLRVVDKCDYCNHLLFAGIEEPACVRNCMGKARVFGDLNNPQSEISKLKEKLSTEEWHPEFGTKPMTFYISLDKEVFQAADSLINE